MAPKIEVSPALLPSINAAWYNENQVQLLI